MNVAVTPLCDREMRATAQHFLDHGTDNERALAYLFLGVYDRTCDMPRVVTFINEWSLEQLNAG